ncbi:transposable element Tcb2 transposase [Trichonephila clavipes]|nr:transposable element Tcb2 transposase [Trichonephila clavipes]
MSQQRDLPESMAWRVIGRLESGQTQRSVADAIGVARSVVARFVKSIPRNRKCESRFSLECDTRRVLVWRDRGTRNNPAFVRERSQYRRAGWMDDNGRPHRARLVENMLEAETIQSIKWPACFSDLNQSSMFGTYSDDALLRDQGRLLRPRLEIALLEEWNSIPQSLIDNLIASMKNRCAVVSAVRGDHMPY